ncbi:hypothetical protein AeMF1_014566 [Aphanomyces euteiches]|nr:hypothetical protein AeMF1_014566 [Aphanomyces euteiches]KAH9183978.1 hypothetical protein AeNC1_014047 [Aphanomyces euteiches]
MSDDNLASSTKTKSSMELDTLSDSFKPPMNMPPKIAALRKDRKYVWLTSDRAWGDRSAGDMIARAPIPKHFIHSKMYHPTKYEASHVFGHISRKSLAGYVYFGSALCGTNGVIHSGCIATIFDELLGLGMIFATGSGGVTLSLTVEHLRSFAADQVGLYFIVVESMEGRKVAVKGRLEDNDGVVYSEARGLYLTVKLPSKPAPSKL